MMKANTWKTILQLQSPSLQPSLLRSELPAVAHKKRDLFYISKAPGAARIGGFFLRMG